MKKIVLNMGLAATTVVGAQQLGAQTTYLDAVKNWNVSTSLQGFYDDNYTTGPSKKGSFGLEVSPTVSANVQLRQTDFSVLYTYGMQYYEQRDHLRVNPIDQNHTFNFWVDHAFSSRTSAKVSNSFVVGQEPELLKNSVTGQTASPFRVDGNNIANNASVVLNNDWSRLLSTQVTYGNNYNSYDYAAYAAALNRDQNTIALDLQWHLSPETFATLGYQFGTVNYTADKVIGTYGSHGQFNYLSSARDNDSQYVYVGLNKNLLPNLTAAVKAGLQYSDYYNDPLQKSTALSPYVLLSLIYTYLPGCNAQVGFVQSRNATDVANVAGNGSLTLDQESSTIYGSINHHITEKWLVSAVANFSNSKFNGGTYDGQSDDDFNLGLNTTYAFTRHVSGQIGYNYDDLTSPQSIRGYTRNRYYIGVTVSY
jgi:hypothetical protein